MREHDHLKSILLGDNPLSRRFRALFALKNIGDNESVEIIAKGIYSFSGQFLTRSPAFQDPSALLKHELAYVLGQMKNPHAIPYLKTVLETETEDAMVRHEVCD